MQGMGNIYLLVRVQTATATKEISVDDPQNS